MVTGRIDPERRERILAATLDHIADVGVAGVSHRRIAARAGVPLGSMTYHFTGIDDLLHEAFTRFAAHIATVFEQHLGAAGNPAQACEAVTDLIHLLSGGPKRDMVIAHELYTLAARRPEYRALTQTWMLRSRHLLQRHFDADTARQLDALIEGLALHRSLDTAPQSRDLTLLAVTRITGTARPAP